MTTEVTNGQIGQKWPVSKMYFLIFTIDNQTNDYNQLNNCFFCHHYELRPNFSPGPLCSFSKCTHLKLPNRRAAKGLFFPKECRGLGNLGNGQNNILNEVAPLL